MLNCVERLTPSNATAAWMQNMRQNVFSYMFSTTVKINLFNLCENLVPPPC